MYIANCTPPVANGRGPLFGMSFGFCLGQIFGQGGALALVHAGALGRPELWAGRSFGQVGALALPQAGALGRLGLWFMQNRTLVLRPLVRLEIVRGQ